MEEFKIAWVNTFPGLELPKGLDLNDPKFYKSVFDWSEYLIPSFPDRIYGRTGELWACLRRNEESILDEDHKAIRWRTYFVTTLKGITYDCK